MNKFNRERVHNAVKQAAAKIDGRLPELRSHPKGRIPTAHIYQVIQTVMESPARFCDDDRVDDVLNIIDRCVELVDVVDVSKSIKHKYAPQAKRVVNTIEHLFVNNE